MLEQLSEQLHSKLLLLLLAQWGPVNEADSTNSKLIYSEIKNSILSFQFQKSCFDLVLSSKRSFTWSKACAPQL